MPEDYEQEVTIKGFDGTANRTIKVTIDGQLYTLLVGANGVVVAVDANGNMSTIIQGISGNTLKTLLCDSDGRLLAQLMGMYGTTPVPVAVSATGSLLLTSLAQSNIEPDPNEGQTWDVSLGTLVNNLNRIRYMLITITGEAWGTVSHSIATVWTKFHATTGHAHTGTGTDAPTIDHGTTTGLTDDDHARYFDKDGSKALTGTILNRNVKNSYLCLLGGTGFTDGTGAGIKVCGADYGDPGYVDILTPNAAHNFSITLLRLIGGTDNPYIDMQNHKIASLRDPVSAQDAATRAWVLSVAIAVTGMITLWSGSIASIPTGWILCNGGGTTPNLKNRFVVGAGDTYAVGATGGEATHALTIAELAAHTHGDSGWSVLYTANQSYRSSANGTETSTSSTGSGTAHENRPPYYALAYIMKT